VNASDGEKASIGKRGGENLGKRGIAGFNFIGLIYWRGRETDDMQNRGKEKNWQIGKWRGRMGDHRDEKKRTQAQTEPKEGIK